MAISIAQAPQQRLTGGVGTSFSTVGNRVLSDVAPGAVPTQYYSPGGSNGVVGTFSTTPPQGHVLGENTGDPNNQNRFNQVAAPDPYAQWGGRAAYDRLVSGFNNQRQNIFGTAGEAATAEGQKLNRGILDFIDQLTSGQKTLNTQAVNNELALRQGREGVMGMVGRGIQSGGVLLANKNASDSSAAGAIARAYGSIGRGQLSNIGNQYELQNRNIQDLQDTFNLKKTRGIEDYQGQKTDAINNIVLQTRTALANLDADMANKSIPDRINIEQEKEKVRQDALGRLAYLDQTLAGASTVAPTSLEQRRSEATRLAGLGQAPADSFNYTDQAPAQFQNGGLPSELPLFTFPRSRRAV